MKRVFILGTGASSELRFFTDILDGGYGYEQKTLHELQGILSSGFFYYANEFKKELNKDSQRLGATYNINNEWLKNFIEEYYFQNTNDKINFIEIFTDKKKSERVNIEKLYIALEDKLQQSKNKNMNNYPTEEEIVVHSGIRNLLEYIHEVCSSIAYFCYSTYHRNLANYIINTGGDVISFNWDILFEEELFYTGKWDYSDGYGFTAADFLDKNKLLNLNKYIYKPKKELSKNIVLKPHGSINWYSKVNDKSEKIYIGIQLTRSNAYRSAKMVREGGLRFTEFANRKVDLDNYYKSLLLPPGKKRKKFLLLWEKIKELLTKADEIVAIGFSFNEFDSYIIDEFSNIKFKDNLNIKIVNPAVGIEEKYKDIFKTNQVKKIFNYISEYCKQIKENS